MGKRKEESDSDYVPSSSAKKKKTKKMKEEASSSAPNVATSTAIVAVEPEKPGWSREDMQGLVKEGIEKHFEEIEEESVIVGLKTFLATHHFDLDWFDSEENESYRAILISKWVDSKIVEAKSELKRASFLTSMNEFKLKSFRASRSNLP